MLKFHALVDWTNLNVKVPNGKKFEDKKWLKLKYFIYLLSEPDVILLLPSAVANDTDSLW